MRIKKDKENKDLILNIELMALAKGDIINNFISKS